MTIDQMLSYVFSVAAQFGIDNAIKVAILFILGSMLLILFIKR